MHKLIVLCFLAVAYGEDISYKYQSVIPLDNDLLNNLTLESSNSLPQIAESPLQNQAVEGPSQQAALLNPEYQKEFYSYAAPESSFDDEDATQTIANIVKRNLRIVFIKSPENKGFEEAAINLAKQASQSQAAIYVLSKQPDIVALANKFQNLKSQSLSDNKPAVHFIKYRTANDAANAQKTIQEQYNNLPGTSQEIHGGNTHVLNFASSAPAANDHISSDPGHQYQQPTTTNSILTTNDYLPPSLRRFRYRL